MKRYPLKMRSMVWAGLIFATMTLLSPPPVGSAPPNRPNPFDAVYEKVVASRLALAVSPEGTGAVRVKVGNAPEGVTEWKLALSRPYLDTKMISRTVAELAGAAPMDPQGQVWKLPALEPGRYDLRVSLKTGETSRSVSQAIWVAADGKIVTDADARFGVVAAKPTGAAKNAPNSGMLRLIDISTAPEGCDAWALELREEGKQAALAKLDGSLPYDRKTKPATIPALPFGRYQAVLTLSGKTEKRELRQDVLIEPEFRYAYFPSHNLVRFLAPEPPENVTGWKLALLGDGQTTPLAEANGVFPMSPAGMNLTTPDLPEGLYAVRLTLTGGDKPIIVERPFRRLHHPWENDKLGMEDVLVQGFAPLQVDAGKRTVQAVLRTHTMNDAGLWDQVNSRGEDILAAAVRLEVVSDGKTFVAHGDAPTFGAGKPTRVEGSASWKAGPLGGRTGFAYDQDGFMQVTLDLDKTDRPIERMQLVIPLKASQAWLMHPVTQQLRMHYAGRVPAGEGKVWDSSGTRAKVGGNFVPYIYVGGPERGICFAADNDRDWVLDEKTPGIEIDREGATVNLRFNLIAGPKTLDRARRIVFGLQATPAKPMPQTPVSWRRWSVAGTDSAGPGVSFGMWGGTLYWAAKTNVVDFGPIDNEFAFWDELARLRREQPKPYRGTESPFLLDYLSRYGNASQEHLQGNYASFSSGLEWASFTPANTPETVLHRYIFPYISPRSASLSDPGFGQTYMDEWSTMDIADPKWKPGPPSRATRQNPLGIYYDCEPVQSNADRILWYHQRMYQTFADGVYWDNYFLKASYVPSEAGGPGYIDDDGNLRPGVNLMAFRNLAKRNAVMMQQMGKRPLAWIHMTNVNIVPFLSFANLNYEWEWRDLGKFKEMDMQQRLRADKDTALILVQSLGLKSGNITVACDRFDPAQRAWQARSTLAVCLPHEIKLHSAGLVGKFVQDRLNEFGYGLEDCRTYRYWEEGFPLRTEGANNHALVLSRGSKAMIALGNFGDGKAGGADAKAGVEDEGRENESVTGYDAVRDKQAKTGGGEVKAVVETYPVVLKLDLKALGLGESVRAFDAEAQAGRAKAAPGDAKEPKPVRGKAAKADAPGPDAGELKRLAPGVFQVDLRRNDFMLIEVR